jgi:hypothetical protein
MAIRFSCLVPPKMTISKSLAAIVALSGLIVSTGVNAETRQAQCLLEVKGVHYIGGPCAYMSLDRMGSFRITDVQGLNLIAQVNVSKKDEGRAVWNGPLGGAGSGVDLGDAYRSGGCWTVNDSSSGQYNDSRICAWGLRDDVYLSPSPKEPDAGSIVYSGSRVGMYNDIVSRRGIDTESATIFTKPSKDGAVQFCREYSRNYSSKCINEQIGDNATHSISANCPLKTFADFNGNHFAFLGANKTKSDDIMAEYSIKDLSSGEILDGSSASGYDVRLDIFKHLCPSAVPKSSN